METLDLREAWDIRAKSPLTPLYYFTLAHLVVHRVTRIDLDPDRRPYFDKVYMVCRDAAGHRPIPATNVGGPGGGVLLEAVPAEGSLCGGCYFPERAVKQRFAQSVVAKARYDGMLTKLVCEVCGDEKTEAHHPDYNRPLEVIWLCRTHHRLWHRDNQVRY